MRVEFTPECPWTEQFVFASEVAKAGTATQFYRSVQAGRFTKVAHGVYLPADYWASLDADSRYLATIHAVDATARIARVHSHLSAAALWRLPIIGPWPNRVHILAKAPMSRSRSQWTAHVSHPDPQPVIINRLKATNLARTVVDVARTAFLSTSVAMADRALSAVPAGTSGVRAQRTTVDALTAELAEGSSYGRARATTALELADGLSGSPGESLSRVGMHILGLPRPVLQHEFRDSRGSMFVDFWWPEFNLIGEFDGVGKYLREDLLNGQTPAQAVMSEKARENRLRALGPSVARWGWSTARDLRQLGRVLREAGLHD